MTIKEKIGNKVIENRQICKTSEIILQNGEKKFSIGQYLVTQDFFETIMGYNPSYFQSKNQQDYDKIPKGENQIYRPVEHVSWFDCILFCNKLTEVTLCKDDCVYTLNDVEKSIEGKIYSANVTINDDKIGYRLPTEIEWNIASENTLNVKNDDRKNDYIWWGKVSDEKTHEVGIKKSNKNKLYDMLGLLWEWSQDCYYQKAPLKDLYLGNNSYMLVKGGSWDVKNIEYCKPSFRYGYKPNFSDKVIGFRICRTVNKCQ